MCVVHTLLYVLAGNACTHTNSLSLSLSLLLCREYEIARQNDASNPAQVRGLVAALLLVLRGQKARAIELEVRTAKMGDLNLFPDLCSIRREIHHGFNVLKK